MMRVTDDLLEVRRWAESRDGRPCRRADGTLTLWFEHQPAPGLPVGWDEFEAKFVRGCNVLVYDDAPGYNRCFVGPVAEARAYVATAAPHASGAAGP